MIFMTFKFFIFNRIYFACFKFSCKKNFLIIFQSFHLIQFQNDFFKCNFKSKNLIQLQFCRHFFKFNFKSNLFESNSKVIILIEFYAIVLIKFQSQCFFMTFKLNYFYKIQCFLVFMKFKKNCFFKYNF